MPSPQNNPSPGENPGETRLDSALDDYLLAKSKANETGNYRWNAERVLDEFLDWAEAQGVETFDALDVADLENYALSLNRRTIGNDGITATTARKYYDYVRAQVLRLRPRVSRVVCQPRVRFREPSREGSRRRSTPNDDERDEHHQQLWTPEQRQVIMRYVEQRAHDAVDERGHDAVKETRDRAFVATIAYAGVRGGEVVRDPNDDRRQGVRWSDLTLDNGTMTVLGKGDQAYETVGLPRQALSALERYHSALEPPNEDWPVFPTLHAPTLLSTAREGLRADDYSTEEIEAELDAQAGFDILRQHGYAPPAITTDGARRLMRTLSENADVPGIDTDSGEYLELHGGRRGAGDTLVREVGWEQAQRLLRHQSPETTMNAYSHISAGEIANDASDAFEETDG
jgi:integrase